MNKHLEPKITNVCVIKLSNSPAKAGPMSEANVLGLAGVSCLDLGHFESQASLSRINQRCLKLLIGKLFWQAADKLIG